ncbi:MAG: lipid II flippase Amj family protein [Pyrinomonadaceae bacterium]
MTVQVKLVFLLTFVIHLISMLSYAVRIAGVRTRRIAVSLAMFNVLLLVSRTSNTFQTPLLAKHVEQSILYGTRAGIESDLRWLLVAATLGSLVGMLSIPTFQRLFGRAIEQLGSHRSMPRLLLRTVSLAGLRDFKTSFSLPVRENVTRLVLRQAPWNMLVYNALASAMLTVGVFASLYAGYLRPELRVTANNLSPVVNAVSTILLLVFIDPYVSLLTDDVVVGRASEAHFRRTLVMLGGSRLAGTIMAQLVLTPGARLIVAIADRL